jgi:hypothetical protein
VRTFDPRDPSQPRRDDITQIQTSWWQSVSPIGRVIVWMLSVLAVIEGALMWAVTKAHTFQRAYEIALGIATPFEDKGQVTTGLVGIALGVSSFLLVPAIAGGVAGLCLDAARKRASRVP